LSTSSVVVDFPRTTRQPGRAASIFAKELTVNRRTKRRIILSASVLGTLAALVAGGLVGRSLYRESQIVQNRKIGLERFAAGQFRESLAPLSIASRGGTDLEVLLALARARLNVSEQGLRHVKIALGMFAKAESLEPGNRVALDGQLECAIQLGYVDQIVAIAERIIALDPGAVRAREAVLEVRAAQGRWADAIAAAEELQRLEPANVRWRAVHMQCLASSGADAEGRLALVDRWIAESGTSAGLALLRADVLRASGRIPDARAIYSELADRGVSEPRLLSALLEGLEATGQSERIDQAIAASAPQLPDPSDVVRIEGERLLSAGRITELRARLASVDLKDPEIVRLKAATEYLVGEFEAARRIVEAAGLPEDRANDLLRAIPIALGDGTRRARVEAIEGAVRSTRQDPIVAIIVSDLLIEAGEFDLAVGLLVDAFEQSGRRSQPVGLRAVRACATLGRVPDALGIARDLGLRYQSDGAVAAAILEAWSSALQAGYVPSRVYGALGSDSPDSLLAYWSDMGRPRELAPLVAEVFARRRMSERAGEIIREVLSSASTAEQVLAILPAAERTSDALTEESLARAVSLPAGPGAALQLANRLAMAGQRARAVELLANASAQAGERDRRRLDRARRSLDAPTDGSVEWLKAELRDDPGIDCASFVLARPEVWNADPTVAAGNAELVEAAVGILRDAIGATSQRALIAEATMNIVFHPSSDARIAASLAALADAERRMPDSVSVLATFARLLEVGSEPDPVRAAGLLARAVQIQPGNAELYPDLVRLLQQTGDFQAAGVAIDTYARLMADDNRAARMAASMRESQGDFDEAAALRAQLSGRTRDAIDRLALLRTKIRAGRLDEAEAELRELAAADDAGLARRELCLLLASSGRIADARRLLDESGSGSAGIGGAGFLEGLRAEIELAYGDLAIAERSARKNRELKPGAPADLLLARVLAADRRIDEARELLVAAIKVAPDDPNILPIAASVLSGDLSERGRAALRTALEAAQAIRPDLVAAVRLIDGATTADGVIRPEPEDLRAARELTVRYSGSSLIWRLAAQFYAASGSAEEAARLALLALSRLPNDESTAELAVLMSIEAGRIDDAAAAAAAWQRIVGANLVAADSARALIEMIRRDPARGAALLEPHLSALVASPNASDALALVVSSNVLAGRSAELPSKLSGLPQERRRMVGSAWLDAAQALALEETVPSVRTLAAFVGESEAHACVAVLAQCCRDGSKDACALASELLPKLGDGGIPRTLLAADIAAAQRSSDAVGLYEGIFLGVADGAASDPSRLAQRLAAEPALRDAFRADPIAIAAMNNLADYLIARGDSLDRAVALARCVTAIVPEANEAKDTLFRGLLATGALVEAKAVAAANPDRLYSAVERAEAAIAGKNALEARAALSDADAIATRRGVVPRALGARLAEARRAIESPEDNAGASS
jgi:tetratricopeptide (TPR) repeat protein